jgi:hypothetical protein
MTESAAHLVDEVLPSVPIRQWVLSVPYALRFLFARDPQAMGAALGIVYRTIAAHLLRKAGLRGMKIIAAIENAELIEKILRHVAPERALEVQAAPRAPPLFTANLFN